MRMPFTLTLLVFIFLIFGGQSKANQYSNIKLYVYSENGDEVILNPTGVVEDTLLPGNTELRKKTFRKKFVSALFAFPAPFGFMGAHRVMLGTKPWVPVVYAATFGGCFGIIPLIDFCVIVFSKDITQYENNPHVFMWIKE
jgi:TM2 domain-containing membrane protein YozV